MDDLAVPPSQDTNISANLASRKALNWNSYSLHSPLSLHLPIVFTRKCRRFLTALNTVSAAAIVKQAAATAELETKRPCVQLTSRTAWKTPHAGNWAYIKQNRIQIIAVSTEQSWTLATVQLIGVAIHFTFNVNRNPIRNHWHHENNWSLLAMEGS